MRVLITGGFGYLGGRIATYVAEQGHDVLLGSRSEKLSPDWLPDVGVVQLHWNDESALRDVCLDVDVIIHAAGMNALDCASDPIAALEFNGVATARLVRASKNAGLSKFIYLSTAHVYASPLVGIITEKTCPSNKHPYATSHLAGENAVLGELIKNNGFIGVVLRLSNGLGAPVNKNANCWMLIVNDLCRQAVEKRKIVLNSPRNIERDFFPLTLLDKTIVSIINLGVIEDSIVNLSSSKAITLEDLVSIICDRSRSVLGFQPDVIYKSDAVENYIDNLSISNARLKKYTPVEIDIRDEIDQLLRNCERWFGT